MDKREFLRLCSAALTSPVIAPLLSWAQSEKLRNWAGNLEYSTEKLTTARSLEEAQAFVTTWITTPMREARYIRRLAKIRDLEKR